MGNENGAGKMIQGCLETFEGKRVLLLQGPMGPFFRRLAQDLEWAGAKVHKVNFNGGDWIFYPAGATAFREEMKEWPSFLERLLLERRIDVVLLFGDCRPIHRVVKGIAKSLHIEVGVFEEGYVRPDYVTLEASGVNGHSRLPTSAIFYLNKPIADVEPTVPVGNTFWPSALWAAIYYVACALLRPWFRHYRHHRPCTLKEAVPWVRSAWRKEYYAIKERGVQEKLTSSLSQKFFLVPLQVHNDSQICVHSPFATVEDFIRNVVRSFARHAPKRTVLVFKHHPMDRGYCDYSRLINTLRESYRLKNRLYYVHDLHLPTLLKHALGVVLVNSTVGMSALHHGTPMKVLGAAIYDMQGLTFQGPLAEFWRQAQNHPVNKLLFQRFRCYLIRHTQINGSFHKRLDAPRSNTGLRWKQFQANHDSDLRWKSDSKQTFSKSVSDRSEACESPTDSIGL
jgi:capsular polysaccharide export protein